MRRWLLTCAVMLVRSWTRAYTTGMDSEIGRRRSTEIESDLWESLHDPENTRAAGVQILARFVLGMPADLSWRLEHSVAGGGLMSKKLALAGIAAVAAIAVWSLFSSPDSLSLPNLPSTPIPYHVERRQGPPPPPPPPPSWEEFVAKVTGKPLPKGRM